MVMPVYLPGLRTRSDFELSIATKASGVEPRRLCFWQVILVASGKHCSNLALPSLV